MKNGGKKLMEELKDIVWEKIKADMEIKKFSESSINARRPYFEAIPEVLANVLNETATLLSVLKARLLYAEYITDSDYYKDIIAAEADEINDQIDIEETVITLKVEGKIALIGLRMTLQEIALLEAMCILNKKDLVEMSKFGLDQKTKRLYQKGKLTIGDLLRIQPLVILKNIDSE